MCVCALLCVSLCVDVCVCVDCARSAWAECRPRRCVCDAGYYPKLATSDCVWWTADFFLMGGCGTERAGQRCRPGRESDMRAFIVVFVFLREEDPTLKTLHTRTVRVATVARRRFPASLRCAAHSADFPSRTTSSFPLYCVFPNENGTYLYLIMCLICRFIVRTKSAMKYRRRIGQKTGMLKTLKKVMKKAMQKALVKEYQNLNSGNLRINGRNSSSRDVGSVCAGERERERERQQRIRAATGGAAAAAAAAAAVCCCRRLLLQSAAAAGCCAHRPLRLRVALRGEEADQQVEHVDAQAVGDNVPPIDQIHAQAIDHHYEG